ncbi:MAG: hypothetical protein A2X25_00995 [Chloroflexi bacterium GWB2_49_20]|nr:MAG: hypothetical protein A2X25_00995 [Chloroflexi bacterium GWB2_49_20]OGN78706.1 MAG: hypothetical protein A2X26_07885 [Chloroflexi bacterium GWC2_49_37]OGN85347.1 MAG: hypothetical protein A2X27_03420 [Chloroflexi bacterium GWD2_49_16]HBG73837.1 hypothetical protein [Anaerolineae bacterium]HCC79427.1 hypothetical protein [Anaerolineae bacterium]
MLPTRSIQKLLETAPPELQEIVLELHNLVAAVAPAATEKIHSKGFSYYFEKRGGPVSAGLCYIDIHRDHVRLGFIHGAFLPDPLGLLIGEPKYKKHILIYSYESADWDYYKKLIAASAAFDPYTLSPGSVPDP